MEKALTGLFGSGPEADAKTQKAQDFVQRYSQGAPDQGYTTDEAVGHLNNLLQHANSDQVEKATRHTLESLPENQRSEFGQFVNQLHERQTGQASGGTPSVNDISRMFGQAGGSANSVGDLFGSLFGGGGGSGGGAGGAITSMLGGLFGGNDESHGTQQQSQSPSSGMGGLGDFMNSGVGKVVIGGIAAYLARELLNQHR
jgi:hypothetical protein